MLLGGLCENLESIHETEDEIRHKAIQRALLSFLMSSVLSFTLQGN
jgi:hypothetical protein